MTMKYYSGLLALLLCLGLSEQYVKNGQWSNSGSFSSSSASSAASSFSSSSSFSQSGSLAKAADLLNDIASGGGSSASAVASTDASAGARAGASAGAFASAGASASFGSKASAGAYSEAKSESGGSSGAAGGLESTSGTDERLYGSNLSEGLAGFNGVFSSAVAGAGAGVGSAPNEGASSSNEHSKGFGFEFGNKGNVEAVGSDVGKSTAGSFASSGATATSASKNLDIPAPKSAATEAPVLFEEPKPTGGHLFTTMNTIKTTGDLQEGVGRAFINKAEGSHYVGPFPGPKGSIFESKPVPGAKYTGPFPGPAGSIYDSKPTVHSSGAFNTAGASAAAGASALSGTHYTGPFPGPVGSIFDSKPVAALHTIAPLDSQEKDQRVVEQSISGGASVSNQAAVAAFAKKKQEFESAYTGKFSGDSFSSTQAGSSSQESLSDKKYGSFGGSISSSQAGATAANEKNGYVGTPIKSGPVLVEQPIFGTSYSSSHAAAASKSSAAEAKHSFEGSFETPVSGVVAVPQKPLKPVYSESFFSKDAGASSQSSAAEGQFIAGSSLDAPVAPSSGVVVLEEQTPLRGVHAEAPADVVIVDHPQHKPVFGSSHTNHFGNYGSHGVKFGSGGSYGYQHRPVEEVLVLEERPRTHAVPGGQVVLLENMPVIMSAAPAGGVILVEDQPKPIYSPTILSTPLAEAPRREVVIVEEKPIKPSIGKPEEIVTVLPVGNPHTVPIGGSCGFRTGCSGFATGENGVNYKGSLENFGKEIAAGTLGSYRGSSSSTGSFGTQDDRLHNSNVAGEFSTSLGTTDNQASNYGASISETNSAAAAKASAAHASAAQASAGSYGSPEKATGTFFNEDDSYKAAIVAPLVPSTHSSNFGGSKGFQNFHGDNAFHSNLKNKEESSLGFNGNFGSALGNSASYSSSRGKTSGSSLENSNLFSDTESVHESRNYAKDSGVSNSNTEGLTGSFGGGASSGAFATSGSFSGSSTSHGLLNGLLNGLESHKQGGNENAVARSDSFSSGGILSSLLGKVKGLADGGNESGSVSGSFSTSHSSASSSAHASSFAASSSFASSGSTGHY